MANAAAFAEHNKSYVATFGDKKHLGLPTSKKVSSLLFLRDIQIVTCYAL
jgi:hypothetical protein